MKNIILYNIENVEIKCLSKKYEIYDENKQYNEKDYIILACIFLGIDKRNEISLAQYDNVKLKKIADSLINNNIVNILEKNNSKLLLFDSWEIMNLDHCSNLQYFITNVLQLELNKIIISSTMFPIRHHNVIGRADAEDADDNAAVDVKW